MTLSHNETQRLINIVLAGSQNSARSILFKELKLTQRTEAEFCAGVIEHGPSMAYTPNQWFDFFTKIPNKLFQHETKLMNKLTPEQQERLQF